MTGSLRMARLDYFTMKTQYAAYASLLIIILMFEMMNASILVLGFNGAWFSALMSCNIFAIQEKNGLDRFYGSVSIRWRDVVFGRYCYLLLSHCATFVLIALTTAGFCLLRGNPILWPDMLQGYGLSLLVYAAIVGVQAPMFFHMGYTKARGWVLAPYLIVIGLVTAPWYVSSLFGYDRLPSLASLLDRASWFLSFHQGLVTVASILLGSIVLFLSCRVSLAVCRRQR